MMRLMTLAGLVLASVTWCSLASAKTLELVPEKSSIGFVGSKADGEHKGGFKKFQTKSIADFEEPANSELTIMIDTPSLWSDDEKLTNHLKSPDFFDVRKYPKAVFKSTEFVSKEPVDGVVKTMIKGELEMLGKVVAIEVPAQIKIDEETLELTAKFSIDRTKWGMTYGEGKVNKDVKIDVQLTFQR